MVVGCRRLFRVLSVGVLNGLTAGWDTKLLVSGAFTRAQKVALRNIERLIQHHAPDTARESPSRPCSELVKCAALDYSGDEVSHALPLKLGELLPGLPKQGKAGSLRAVDAAEDLVRAWVVNPYLTLKDESLWPAEVPQPKINASKDEWYEVDLQGRRRSVPMYYPLVCRKRV